MSLIPHLRTKRNHNDGSTHMFFTSSPLHYCPRPAILRRRWRRAIPWIAALLVPCLLGYIVVEAGISGGMFMLGVLLLTAVVVRIGGRS